MKISISPFGFTKDDRPISSYALVNANGMQARFIDYGCILTHLIIPDRTGKETDVVLGYDDIRSYENDNAYLGALVGRYANRIRNSAFTLNGKEYRLTPNDGLNHLHGVLSKRMFKCEAAGDFLEFSYNSPAGEDGLPGNVKIKMICSLDDDNVLTLRYEAVSDEDTIINLTNHSYFNLAGHDSGKIDDQLLLIAADSFLETSADACPTGKILPAEGPMDFRILRNIGPGFLEPCSQMDLVGGYDHCYILRDVEETAAYAYCPETGISLTIATTQPGIQFYSGNYLYEIGSPGKSGYEYTRRSGFALETQHYPCSPNFPEFPSTVLKAGELYSEITSFRLTVDQSTETH